MTTPPTDVHSQTIYRATASLSDTTSGDADSENTDTTDADEASEDTDAEGTDTDSEDTETKTVEKEITIYVGDETGDDRYVKADDSKEVYTINERLPDRYPGQQGF